MGSKLTLTCSNHLVTYYLPLVNLQNAFKVLLLKIKNDSRHRATVFSCTLMITTSSAAATAAFFYFFSAWKTIQLNGLSEVLVNDAVNIAEFTLGI